MPSCATCMRRDDRWKVTLDRTAFYPTSGGQPFDTGTLGEAKVLEVFDDEDGTVGHFVDRELEKNSRVRGHIDWDRRFDHMQQHTGQHLLSAAFEREMGAKTVSFHLGGSASTIDLDKELSAEQVARVEDAGQQGAVGGSRSLREVRHRRRGGEAAASEGSMRETGELRIIEIKDYDLSACGGTHVRRTGAIGMIAISGFERFKGGLRVEFVCGARALRAYRALEECRERQRPAAFGASRRTAVGDREAAGRRSRSAESDRTRCTNGLPCTKRRACIASGQKVGDATLVAAAVSGWDANRPEETRVGDCRQTGDDRRAAHL